MGKYIISNFKNEFIFWKKKKTHFVNVETVPRLQYAYNMPSHNTRKTVAGLYELFKTGRRERISAKGMI
jgi:hypothetical protein